ncbi:MAG TPA: O-methyltransferase [Candidatus Eisenbacteria bacterium]|nr:O-methyltransferase [Candidatus Eisenbacteria bacterium]
MPETATQELWTEVDQYLSASLAPADPALVGALDSSTQAGLPEIQVSTVQGKLLHILARVMGARRILEIGTLGGYSTIWLARALPPDGKLISLEADPKHADVARANVARAGLAGVVDIPLGRALETLPAIASASEGPFDLIFIDADKPSIPEYFAWSLKLSRKGSLLLVDNVVRDGKVIEEKSEDENVQGVRRFFDLLAAEKRVSATAIQTVGAKGYDGLAIALVTSDR